MKNKKNSSNEIAETANVAEIKNSVTVVPNKFLFATYIALFFFAFLLYANTITYDFVLDDTAAITKNKIVQQGVSGIPQLLKTGFYYGFFGYNNNLYRPLPLITFAIGQSIWGNNPHAEHLVNVLLFALTCVFIFHVLLQLFGKQSWLLAAFIAFLFAAHPIHTEVVANIKSRDELLALLFAMAALYQAQLSVRKKSYLHLLLSGLLLFIGILSKESALAFIVIIPLSIFFYNDKETGGGLKAGLINVSAASIAAGIIYFVVRYSLFHNDPGTITEVKLMDNVMANTNFFERFPTAIYILGRYLKLLLFPHPLVYDYSFKEITMVGWGNIGFIVSLLVYIVIAFLVVKFFLQKNKMVFGALAFLAGIFIVSNIAITIGAGMAERFLFAPSLGFCILIGVMVFQLTGASASDSNATNFKTRVLPILVILLLALSIKTISRNGSWKDQYTLFSDDIKNASLSARAHYSLGTQLLEVGRTKAEAEKAEMFSKAETELKRAISIYPQYAEAILSLGNLYQEKGDFVKADEYLSKISSSGVGASGSSAEQLLYNKGNALLGLNDYRGAIDLYQQCIGINPKMTEAYINMGVAFKGMNNLDSAIVVISQAIAIDAKSAEAYLNLGTCYSAKNDSKNAIANFEKAIALNPKFAEAYIDLGDVYSRENKFQEAEKAFKYAISLNPSIPEGHFNLGYLYMKKENYSEALSYLGKATTLRAGYLDALANASFCASKLNRYQEVIDYALKAIAIRPDIPDLYYNVAFGYNQLGNKTMAMEYKMKGDRLKTGK